MKTWVLILAILLFSVAVYGSGRGLHTSTSMRMDLRMGGSAGELTYENYQVSDGVGGWENYQVSDGVGGWENYQVRE